MINKKATMVHTGETKECPRCGKPGLKEGDTCPKCKTEILSWGY